VLRPGRRLGGLLLLLREPRIRDLNLISQGASGLKRKWVADRPATKPAFLEETDFSSSLVMSG